MIMCFTVTSLISAFFDIPSLHSPLQMIPSLQDIILTKAGNIHTVKFSLSVCIAIANN